MDIESQDVVRNAPFYSTVVPLDGSPTIAKAVERCENALFRLTFRGSLLAGAPLVYTTPWTLEYSEGGAQPQFALVAVIGCVRELQDAVPI